MVKKTLFLSGIPKGCAATRMEGNTYNSKAVARRYEKLIPKSLNILLQAVGPDGHIASLFPGSPS